MGYLAGGPIQSVARVTVEAAASSQQVNIPVPGGFVPGMTDVYIGGACLSQGDYDDTDGMQIKLRNGMASGTQYRVVAFGAYTKQQPVGGQLAGGRNRIINGRGMIAQRNPYVSTNGTYGFGGPDRFAAQNGGGTTGQFTQSQGFFTYDNFTRNSIKQNVDSPCASFAGNAFWWGVTQLIEGYNCYDLVASAMVLSFLFYSNVSGTFCASLRDGTAPNNSYVTTFTAVANTPTRVVIPMPVGNLVIGASNAIGMYVNIGALNTGIYQAPLLNAWQVGSFFTAAGATNWGAAVGNFIQVTDIQLEPGSVATQFETKPYSLEFQTCQRYYEQGSYGFAGTCSLSGAATQTGVYFAVPKRQAPTVTLPTSSNAGPFPATNSTGGIAANYFSVGAVSTGTGGFIIGGTFNANAEL